MKDIYNFFEKRLEQTYESTNVGDATLYLKNGHVVALKKDNVINMYCQCDPRTIWNHYNIAAVAIIKDFNIVTNLKSKKVADVMVITGLCGAAKGISRVNELLLETSTFNELDLLLPLVKVSLSNDYLSTDTMGQITESSIFFNDFNFSISYEHSYTSNWDEFLSINIYTFGEYKKDKKRKRKHDSYYYDYYISSTYEILRLSADWHWNAGYYTAGSDDVRKQIEKIKKQNYHQISNASLVF